MTITESADPVTVGDSYTYTVTGIAPIDCEFGNGNCDLPMSGTVDLRHGSVPATITAASGSSVNGPASCSFQFTPGFGYVGGCQYGYVPHGTVMTEDVA